MTRGGVSTWRWPLWDGSPGTCELSQRLSPAESRSDSPTEEQGPGSPLRASPLLLGDPAVRRPESITSETRPQGQRGSRDPGEAGSRQQCCSLSPSFPDEPGCAEATGPGGALGEPSPPSWEHPSPPSPPCWEHPPFPSPPCSEHPPLTLLPAGITHPSLPLPSLLGASMPSLPSQLGALTFLPGDPSESGPSPEISAHSSLTPFLSPAPPSAPPAPPSAAGRTPLSFLPESI